MTELVKNVCLTPELLTGDIMKNVFEKIKENYEKKSFKEDGYIYNIRPKFAILDNFVSPSSTSQIICKVKFLATVIKPKIGDVFEGCVKAVDERAVIITFDNIMDIIIASQRMSECVYDKSKSMFLETQRDGTKKNITIGSCIKAEITAIRFDKKFNCVGKLVK